MTHTYYTNFVDLGQTLRNPLLPHMLSIIPNLVAVILFWA